MQWQIHLPIFDCVAEFLRLINDLDYRIQPMGQVAYRMRDRCGIQIIIEQENAHWSIIKNDSWDGWEGDGLLELYPWEDDVLRGTPKEIEAALRKEIK